MEYIQMTLDDWLQEKELLRKDLVTAAEAFVRIGCRLRKIRDTKAYERDGYHSLGEFAEAEYKIAKSTTSTFIKIHETFSKGPDSMELQDRYKGMGSTILAEMLKLPEADRELVTEDTTRAQIREMKDFNKTEPVEQGTMKEVIIELFRQKPALLNDFYSSEGYITGDMEELADILNPSGNMSFRYGKYMLFFYDLDKGIKYKVFGDRENHEMSYAELFSLMQEIYQDCICGNRTHQAYYGEPEVKTEVKETTTVKTTTTVTPQNAKKPEQKEEKHEQKEEKSDQKSEEKEPEKVPPAEPEKPINTKADTDLEASKEEQIPGQQEITDYPETIPEDMEVEKVESEVEDKNQTRKEYLDGCTEYGAAVYLQRWFKNDPEAAVIITDVDRMEAWLKVKVDINGRDD